MTLLAPAPAQGRLRDGSVFCSGFAQGLLTCVGFLAFGQKALSYICKQTGGKQIQGGDGDGPIHSSDFLREPFRRRLPF